MHWATHASRDPRAATPSGAVARGAADRARAAAIDTPRPGIQNARCHRPLSAAFEETQVHIVRGVRKLVLLGTLAAFAAASASAQVRVGSKNFTEQFIVAELYAQALEAAGIKVERKINLGGTLIAHKALEERAIDLYPEYTGTMLIAVLKGEPMTDRKAVYDKVKAEYAAKGLVVLNETSFQNTYNMVVRPETAAQYKLETLSDLARVAGELRLGAGPEFRDRKDGLPGLKAKYGIEFKEDLQMAIGLRYQALAGKQIEVVNGYSTDGMISALKLKRLKDDKNLWPPYYLAPVVRKDALDANPKIADVLNQVSAVLDEAAMTEMNYKVDGEKEEPKDVARAFLKARGIVR
jgi:osmoprotectant transport system substrate-binding protein